MVRASCCDHKMGLRKGPWSVEEDQILISHIQKYGHATWRALPKQAGLLRCGKSCRLRWINYLRPDIKRGNFSPQEEETIIKLHQILGNRWSAIAAKLPGRTDNEIKNVWHTHLKKRLIQNQIKQNPKPKSKSKIKFDNSSKTKSESGNYPSFNIPSRTQLPWQTTPQPSSSSSSSSSSEASSSIIDAKTATIMDTKGENLENPWEYFSAIDQSFLSDHALSSSDDSTAVPLKFEGVFDEFLSRAPSSSIDHAIGEPDYGYSQNLDDAMEFWYDLFIKAGDGQEIVTEF